MSSLFLADGPSDIIQKTVTQVDIVSMQFLSQIFFVKQITVTILQTQETFEYLQSKPCWSFQIREDFFKQTLGSLSLNIFNVQKS